MTHLQGRLQTPGRMAELAADNMAQCPQRQLTVALQGLPQWRDTELARLARQQGHAQAQTHPAAPALLLCPHILGALFRHRSLSRQPGQPVHRSGFSRRHDAQKRFKSLPPTL